MLLAIDTSTTHLSLAVFDGSEILGECCWSSPNRHTMVLAPSVHDMLTSLEVDTKKLKAITVALGPGSFTSLRVGLSFAKGMALGLGIPLIGVPSLDIIAAQQPISDLPLCAFLQAGRGKLATSLYSVKRGHWYGDGEVEVFTVEELCQKFTEETILCGEFNAEMRTEFRRQNKKLKLSSPAMSLRRAAFLAEIGWKIYEKGSYGSAETIAPVYLHTHDPIPG